MIQTGKNIITKAQKKWTRQQQFVEKICRKYDIFSNNSRRKHFLQLIFFYGFHGRAQQVKYSNQIIKIKINKKFLLSNHVELNQIFLAHLQFQTHLWQSILEKGIHLFMRKSIQDQRITQVNESIFQSTMNNFVIQMNNISQDGNYCKIFPRFQSKNSTETKNTLPSINNIFQKKMDLEHVTTLAQNPPGTNDQIDNPANTRFARQKSYENPMIKGIISSKDQLTQQKSRIDTAAIADHVYRIIEKKIQIERERSGRWF